MFTLKQRNLALNVISIATLKNNIAQSNDKIKINKLDVYKSERDELND